MIYNEKTRKQIAFNLDTNLLKLYYPSKSWNSAYEVIKNYMLKNDLREVPRDHCMIKLWNSRVTDEDNVYIIGDFVYRSGESAEWYLRQLKGHKHLVIGNHDKTTLENPKAMSYFESVDKMKHVEDGDKHICHYPLAEWYKSRHGSLHFCSISG